MRDILVVAIVLLSAPVAVFSPYYGVLVWTWIAYFNPHRYTWGFAREFPVAMIIAIPTLIGLLFARKNRHCFTLESLLLIALWIWFGLTTLYIGYVPAFAGHLSDARFHFIEVSKILLMTVATILLVTSKEKLRMMVIVIAASFGVRALVAAIFFIQTGGQYRIWGPDGTFIADNNDFGLALNMTIPFLFFMVGITQQKWIRISLRILLAATVLSVIGTYSRGGALGLAVVILALTFKSRHRLIGMFVVAIALFAVVTFSAAEWKDRMDDFVHGKLDESAQSRLATWRGGWNLALDYPVTGGGFDAYPDSGLMTRYIPGSSLDSAFKGPHSIYFQMLGEQGFVGLSLFLLLLVACFTTLRRMRRVASRSEALRWAVPYTQMFEVSLLAYVVGGATLGRAYFDFMYHVVACIVVLKILFMQDCAALVMAAAPDTSPAYEPDELAIGAVVA